MIVIEESIHKFGHLSHSADHFPHNSPTSRYVLTKSMLEAQPATATTDQLQSLLIPLLSSFLDYLRAAATPNITVGQTMAANPNLISDLMTMDQQLGLSSKVSSCPPLSDDRAAIPSSQRDSEVQGKISVIDTAIQQLNPVIEGTSVISIPSGLIDKDAQQVENPSPSSQTIPLIPNIGNFSEGRAPCRLDPVPSDPIHSSPGLSMVGAPPAEHHLHKFFANTIIGSLPLRQRETRSFESSSSTSMGWYSHGTPIEPVDVFSFGIVLWEYSLERSLMPTCIMVQL